VTPDRIGQLFWQLKSRSGSMPSDQLHRARHYEFE